jgi:hypothetical protein
MRASAANTHARFILPVALDERGLVPESYAHGRDLFLIKRAVAAKYLGRKPAFVRRRTFPAARSRPITAVNSRAVQVPGVESKRL